MYPDLLEQAGYQVGHTGKGWGPGDFKAGGFSRNPPGRLTSSTSSSPRCRGSAPPISRGTSPPSSRNGSPASPSASGSAATSPTAPTRKAPGRRAGRDPPRVTLPAYFPDSNVIRSDMLDYALEVEWFDANLGKILDQLEKIGELDDTLILVTSDHGMPFPRVKGQIYEAGFHMPMAIRWGRRVKPGRVVERLHQRARLRPHVPRGRRTRGPRVDERPKLPRRAREREIGPDRSRRATGW